MQFEWHYHSSATYCKNLFEFLALTGNENIKTLDMTHCAHTYILSCAHALVIRDVGDTESNVLVLMQLKGWT